MANEIQVTLLHSKANQTGNQCRGSRTRGAPALNGPGDGLGPLGFTTNRIAHRGIEPGIGRRPLSDPALSKFYWRWHLLLCILSHLHKRWKLSIKQLPLTAT